VTFSKDAAANDWAYQFTLVDVGTGTAINPTVPGARDMQFNGDGTLNILNGTTGTSATPASDPVTFTGAAIIAGRAVNNLTISVNFGTFDQATGTTQFDAAFAPSLLNQDGSAPSALTSVVIDDTGLLSAQFANGQSRAVYRIPIGSIPSPTELEPVSGNAYRTTGTSGDIVLNLAQQGGSGRIQSSALENSTVDIAEEFTDLIITQRAYSAATRIITTGDELLEEIIRVKR
ncbi:MAG: flagellar hook-basal body complex protein, partial [Proteobacteria bacterium]|nr:flagellar hook-basal body complex protein [Pseudomonadota bacterium]